MPNTDFSFTFEPCGAGHIARPTTPRRRIADSTTVHLINGYVGQVIFEGRIVHQTRVYKTTVKAKEAAEKVISDRVTELFA